MKNIGFIGIGIMGRSMAANLIKAGFRLTVHTRRKEKIEDFLRESGAEWAESPARLRQRTGRGYHNGRLSQRRGRRLLWGKRHFIWRGAGRLSN